MTALDNIRRVLDYHGFTKHLYVDTARVDQDRIFCWPKDDYVLKSMASDGWVPDSGKVASFNHGTVLTFREPSVSPSMQISFHRQPVGAGGYFIEIDLDFYSPSNGIKGFFGHAWEVLQNKVTRKKTNQEKMSTSLDRRFKNTDKRLP